MLMDILGNNGVGQLEPDQTPPDNAKLVIGIGNLGKRRALFERYGKERFIHVQHRTCWPAQGTVIGFGCQLMSGVIIQPGVTLGDNVLVNTGAQIDHDCKIGDHVHIAPGAILCGGVTVERYVFIGAGAVVAENTVIPRGNFVKAGSVSGVAA